MALVSGKSSRERGRVVRIQMVSCRMPKAMPQLLLLIGNLEVRYLASDADRLCSSIGGWLRPSRSRYILTDS